MPTNIPHHDALYRLAQVGATLGVQLVQIGSCNGDNTYTALPVEFDADGGTELVEQIEIEVTNLAEPADAPGTTPQGTAAVALDVEGRWVVFVQPPRAASIVARISQSLGQANYSVTEQATDSTGQWHDTLPLRTFTACNLAEQSLGSGAALDNGTLVIVQAMNAGGQTRYIFDHPAYAKYLD